MTTLRDLLNKCSYKSVFNVLYREYYKGKPDSEVELADVAYLTVRKNLLAKEQKPNKDYQICIKKVLDDSVAPPKSHIDVCLYCNDDDETYAIDLMPWGDLIDAQIMNKTRLRHNTILAHILWEMTFYGFTEESVSLEKKKLEEQIEKIERGEEELTPWEDIRAELGLDDKADSLDS